MRYWPAILVLTNLSAAIAADPPPPSGDHTFARSGNAQCVTWYAVPGVSARETGGYIGGGAAHGGCDRGPADGTWGLDYLARGVRYDRIFLNWRHDGRQPHAGPYKIDGPHVPDVFAIKPVRRAVEKAKGHE